MIDPDDMNQFIDEFCDSSIWLILTAFALIMVVCFLGGCGGGSSDPSQSVNPQVKIGVIPLRCNEAPEAPACPASQPTVSPTAVIH